MKTQDAGRNTQGTCRQEGPLTLVFVIEGRGPQEETLILCGTPRKLIALITPNAMGRA